MTTLRTRDLGIVDRLLYSWRAEQKRAESQSRTRQSMRAEQEKLARLRHENAVLSKSEMFYDLRG